MALCGPSLGPCWALLGPLLCLPWVQWAFTGPSLCPPGPSGWSPWASLGLPWASLVPSPGLPGPPLGLPLGLHGAFMGGLHVAFMGPWTCLCPPLGFLWSSWGLSLALCGPALGPCWALLGPLLCTPWVHWAFLGHSLVPPGPSGGSPCASLGPPWACLVPSSGLPGPPPWACQWAFSGHPMVAHVPPGPTPWAHSRHRRAQGWTKEGPMHPRRPQEGPREGPARAQGGPTQGQRRTPGRHQGGPEKAPGGPQEGHGEAQAQTNPYERNGKAQ